MLRTISAPQDARWYAEEIETGRASMSAADFTQATEIADAYRRRHEWPAERIDFASGFFNGYDDSTHCEKHVAPRK